MALNKPIKQTNGVTLAYHRIAMINVQVNQQISMLVESYIDESGRKYEKDYAKGLIKEEPTFPYTQSEYVILKYDENMDMFKGNITQKAYNWLKTQEKFKGSTDILEV